MRSAPNLSAAPAPCVSHPMAMSRKPSVGDEVKEEMPRSIGATAKDLAKLLGSSPRTSSSVGSRVETRGCGGVDEVLHVFSMNFMAFQGRRGLKPCSNAAPEALKVPAPVQRAWG